MVATHSINVAATHSTGHASLGALLRGGGGGRGAGNSLFFGALHIPATHFVHVAVIHWSGHAYLDVFWAGGEGDWALKKVLFCVALCICLQLTLYIGCNSLD